MTVVKKVSRQTFETRKKIKINKTNEDIKLNIDYKSIDVRDVYGFYLTNKTTKNNIRKLPDIGSFLNIFPDFLNFRDFLSHKKYSLFLSCISQNLKPKFHVSSSLLLKPNRINSNLPKQHDLYFYHQKD